MRAFLFAGLALLSLPSEAAVCDRSLVEEVVGKGELHEIWPSGGVPCRAGTAPWTCDSTENRIVRLGNVNVPAVQFFRAPGAGLRPAVVICPGGSYTLLAFNHEGTEVAEWMNAQGVSAFVLRYRVPNQRDAAHMDAQRAVSFVRAKAGDFGVDSKRVGLMGFSAGANLTARTSTNFKCRAYAAVDAIDETSCRPDFSIVIYPWMLVHGENSEKTLPLTLRAEFPVDADTPPTFLVQTEDDGAHVENALGYYTALKYAGVPAEMHLYPDGGHGYGMRPTPASVNGWQTRLADWLRRTVMNKEDK